MPTCDLGGWASAGTARVPTAAEIAAGFVCGPADPELFNGIIQALCKCCIDTTGWADGSLPIYDLATDTFVEQTIPDLVARGL